jgi:hypothetical protein
MRYSFEPLSVVEESRSEALDTVYSSLTGHNLMSRLRIQSNPLIPSLGFFMNHWPTATYFQYAVFAFIWRWASSTFSRHASTIGTFHIYTLFGFSRIIMRCKI